MSVERSEYIRVISISNQESKTQQDIRHEIKVFKKDYVQKFGTEEGWRSQYLNNFFLHFPHPDKDMMTYRSMLTVFPKDAWEKPFKEIFPTSRNDEYSYSDFFLNKTPVMFYKDLDQATILHKVKPVDISQHYSNHDEKAREKMNKLLLPVYISMREKGYSHYKDLTA